jgi:DNA-binding HxlR family transcriptional regulator
MKRRTSSCPVCYALDAFGDKWTLLILRDMLVRQKRYYGDFLTSGEGIATNILANRLKQLLDQGLITKTNDPDNKTQAIYTPTQKARALLPVLGAMVKWGLQYGPKTKDPSKA